MRVYLCILVLFLLSCEDDDDSFTPTCRLMTYDPLKILAEYGDTASNQEFYELIYDKDILIKRINNGFNSYDTLIYENGRLVELHKIYQASHINRIFKYSYENNRISRSDQYYFSIEQNEWIIGSTSFREYDSDGRVISFKNEIPNSQSKYPYKIELITLTYDGQNLSRVDEIGYDVLNETDTVESYQITEVFRDYDDKENPFKGQPFGDVFFRSVSENNFQFFYHWSKGISSQENEFTWAFKLNYDDLGYPKFGRYECK